MRVLPLFKRKSVVVPTAVVAVLALGGTAAAVGGAFDHAGPNPDGTAVTPVGYTVTPAGHQQKLGDLPLHATPSPDGKYVLVTNDGQGTQSLQVVSTSDSSVRQTIEYKSPEALFTGLAFSKDGKTVYASAGGNNKIRTFSFDNGKLTEGKSFPLPTTSESGKKLNPYPAGITPTPDGKRLLIADRLADAVTSLDLSTGKTTTTGVGHAPYWISVAPDGNRAWVSEQGANTVRALDITGGGVKPGATTTVGTHPDETVLDKAGKNLYVANADSDSVSVVDTASGKASKTISLAPYQNAQVGTNPAGLALSADERTLYVANSGNNDVAVIDTHSGRTRGLIPTGWYPTSVVPLQDKLFVTNAKGLGAGPNNGPGQPNPEDPNKGDPAKYSGSMMVGTLSTMDANPDQKTLSRWTKQVEKNNDFGNGSSVRGASSPVIPRHAGQKSPIKHVIYVVRENRTYDQEFGSLGKGNGDPKINLFGDESAPNSRALQKKFATLDNFYADAEVSAQGWNWTVAANSNLYSEQGWPANYSGRNHSYTSESGEPSIAPNRKPADSYIWDRLADAKVPFRNYGFYVSEKNGKFVADDPKLNASTNHDFRGFDLNCPDSPGTFTAPASCGTPRIDQWAKDFKNYERDGNLPTVEFVRLPNDHTAGTKKGSPTPKAYVADNDLALGKLVDTVSHSKYWGSTAIFATEDDAQNGPDHVDAHRTVAQVISPYTQQGKVDSTFYSTASMLRTIELLVGIKPMTQFDSYSTPMAWSFGKQPNAKPYSAITPTTPLNERNGATAPMAKQSSAQNLGVEDAIDEQTFNKAIWQSVRGNGATMPAPKHEVVRGNGSATGEADGDGDGD